MKKTTTTKHERRTRSTQTTIAKEWKNAGRRWPKAADRTQDRYLICAYSQQPRGITIPVAVWRC